MNFGGLGLRIKKYFAIFWIQLKEKTASPIDLLFRSIFFAVVIFIFSRLWAELTPTGSSRTLGNSASDLVWYLYLTEAIILSLPPLSELVDQDIQTGAIAYQLVRPMSYIANRAAGFMGDVFARFLVNAIIGAVFCAFLVGFPSRPSFFILAPILMFGAFVLHMAFCLLISILGFWVEDTLPFFWMYQKAGFVLGGLFMPIDYYPVWLRRFCDFLPFRDGVYSVAQIALTGSGRFSIHSLFWNTLLRQGLWAGVAIATTFWFYSLGIKRLEVNGG